MKLKEVFEALSQTELSQLSIGGQDQGVINTANQGTVLNAVNLGLASLHQRFTLREGYLTLLLEPSTLTYPLHSRYSENDEDSSELVRYIKGTYLNDLAKIIKVVGNVSGELGLNDNKVGSCRTPSVYSLRVPAGLADTELELTYRAIHPVIAPDFSGYLDLDETEVDLPYNYLEPLLYFVAGRIHHPIGMVGDFQMGSSYAAKYEAACQRLELSNLQVDNYNETTRFEENGWV